MTYRDYIGKSEEGKIALSDPVRYKAWLDREICRIYRLVPRKWITGWDYELDVETKHYVPDGTAFSKSFDGLPKLDDIIK